MLFVICSALDVIFVFHTFISENVLIFLNFNPVHNAISNGLNNNSSNCFLLEHELKVTKAIFLTKIFSCPIALNDKRLLFRIRIV